MPVLAAPHMPGFAHIHAVVFDLDGTLIDSTPGIGSALFAAFEAAGRSMPETDLRRIIGPPITVIARRIDPSLSDGEVATIELAYRTLYDGEGWRNTLPFPSVSETLHNLHEQGLALFIVTNKPLLPTTNILRHLGLSHLFRETLTRDSRTPAFATKAEMLAELLIRQDLDPGSTLMVGDTSEDQEAAHANGLEFVHVTYGYGALPGATYPIDDFSEIRNFFQYTARQ